MSTPTRERDVGEDPIHSRTVCTSDGNRCDQMLPRDELTVADLGNGSGRAPGQQLLNRNRTNSVRLGVPRTRSGVVMGTKSLLSRGPRRGGPACIPGLAIDPMNGGQSSSHSTTASAT